jgi:hypothetical protein
MAAREGRSSHLERRVKSRDNCLPLRRVEECNKEQRIFEYREPSTVLRVVDIDYNPTKPSSQTPGSDLYRVNDLVCRRTPNLRPNQALCMLGITLGHALCKLNLNLHPCPRLLENDETY